MKWVKNNVDDRKEYLPSLLEHVRLSLLTPRYLTDIVDNEVANFAIFLCIFSHVHAFFGMTVSMTFNTSLASFNRF